MNKQNGNALFFILIAIALLGLLTVSLSRSGDSTNETGSYEQNQIAASEVLSYAKDIENAVQNLLARGCSENTISFENSVVAGYTNPNSPADKSCHVFDVSGTGLTFENNGGLISGGLEITDIATSRTELLFILEDQDADFCTQVNRLSNAPVIDEAYTTPAQFIGAYTASGSIGSVGETQGVQTACFENTTDSSQILYHVLHTR